MKENLFVIKLVEKQFSNKRTMECGNGHDEKNRNANVIYFSPYRYGTL